MSDPIYFIVLEVPPVSGALSSCYMKYCIVIDAYNFLHIRFHCLSTAHILAVIIVLSFPCHVGRCRSNVVVMFLDSFLNCMMILIFAVIWS